MAHGGHGSLVEFEQIVGIGAFHALRAALKQAHVVHRGHVHRFGEDAVLQG